MTTICGGGGYMFPPCPGRTFPAGNPPSNLTHVTATLFIQPPFVNDCGYNYLLGKRDNCTHPGTCVELFLFMTTLLNITYDAKLAPAMGAPDAKGDWGNSVIGMLNRSEANISINVPYHTFVRAQAVNYMNPIGNSKLAVMISKRTGNLRVDILFLPFSYKTWALIFGGTAGVCGLALLTLILQKRFLINSPRAKGTFRDQVTKSIEHTIWAIFSKGHEIKTGDPYRFIMVCWHLVMFIVGAMYAEMLYNHFVNSFDFEPPFQDVGALATAINTKAYKVLIPNGIYQYLLNILAVTTQPGMLALKAALASNNITIIPDVTRFDAPKRMQVDTVLIDIDSIMRMTLNRNCSVMMIDIADFMTEYISMVFSKAWPYQDQFNRWAQILFDYYNYIDYKYATSGTPACTGGDDHSGGTALSLDATWFTFQVYVIGCFIAACIYVIRWLWNRRLKKKFERQLLNSKPIAAVIEQYNQFTQEEGDGTGAGGQDIMAELNNQGRKSRLSMIASQYEVPPSPGMWTKFTRESTHQTGSHDVEVLQIPPRPKLSMALPGQGSPTVMQPKINGFFE